MKGEPLVIVSSRLYVSIMPAKLAQEVALGILPPVLSCDPIMALKSPISNQGAAEGDRFRSSFKSLHRVPMSTLERDPVKVLRAFKVQCNFLIKS